MRKKRSLTNIDRYELWTHQTTSVNDKVNCRSLSAKKLRKQQWLTHDLNCVLTKPWLRFLLSEMFGAWWFGPLAKAHNIITSLVWKWQKWLTDSIHPFLVTSFILKKILHVTSCGTLKKETPKIHNSTSTHFWIILDLVLVLPLHQHLHSEKTHPIPQLQGRYSCASKSPWRWSTCPRARSVRSRTWPKQQARREVV